MVWIAKNAREDVDVRHVTEKARSCRSNNTVGRSVCLNTSVRRHLISTLTDVDANRRRPWLLGAGSRFSIHTATWRDVTPSRHLFCQSREFTLVLCRAVETRIFTTHSITAISCLRLGCQCWTDKWTRFLPVLTDIKTTVIRTQAICRWWFCQFYSVICLLPLKNASARSKPGIKNDD